MLAPTTIAVDTAASHFWLLPLLPLAIGQILASVNVSHNDLKDVSQLEFLGSGMGAGQRKASPFSLSRCNRGSQLLESPPTHVGRILAVIRAVLMARKRDKTASTPGRNSTLGSGWSVYEPPPESSAALVGLTFCLTIPQRTNRCR